MPLSQLLQGSSSELQAELQLILNAVVEGLCGVDAHGNMTFCNDALLRMTGYQTKELLGRSLHSLLHHTRRDGTEYPCEKCSLRAAIQAGQEMHAVREILWRKDGTWFPAEYWAHPLPHHSSAAVSVITIEDTSERERAIEALRTSEERFRQISNNIDQTFYLVDTRTSHLVYASPAFETITGRATEEVCGKPSPWRDLATPEHRERVIGDHLRLMAGEETRSEYQIQHSNGSKRWVKDHAKPIRSEGGEVCMYAGVVEDITEIHDARDVLRQNEEKYRRLLTSFPDVAWTSDGERRTSYISPKVESVLGYTKQEFCSSSNLRSGLIHPEDFGRVNRGYRALFEKQSLFDEEYRIRRKDGTWIWIHDRATGTHEEEGIVFADGVFTDITRRKQTEAELRSKTAFLEAQANCTIDGILVVAGNGQRLLHNQRFVDLFQVPTEILANQDDGPMAHHIAGLIKDRELFLAKIEHAYRQPSEVIRDEIELKDGRVMDRYSAPVIDAQGTYYGRIWTFRDITERKRNEDMLRQLSMAVEQSPVSVVITDPRGDISYVNQRFTETTGYQRDEVLGQNPRILNAGRSSPELFENLWSTVTQGREWHGELCNRKKNGEVYWEAVTIRPITDGKGAIRHYLAIKEDITERRQAEETLKASEKRYRLLFERNLAGVLRTTLEGKVLECNQATARMFGYDLPEEILLLPAARLYHTSSDREAFLTKIKHEKSVTNHEMKLRHRNGSSVWVIASFSLIDEEGNAGAIVEGTLVDITERKKAEEGLYESQQMLQSILNAIPQRVFWKGLDGCYLGCNRAFATDAGLDRPATIIGKSDFDLTWNQVAELYRADDQLVMREGAVKLNFEERQTRADGSMLWLQTNKLPLRDRDGRVSGILGTYEDITERKNTEQTLQRSEEKFRELAENIHEVFWMMSPNADEILYVSPAYEQIWGRMRTSLYENPMAWAEAILPEDRDSAHALFARQMQGERIESEYRIRTPEGQEKWISDRAFPVRDQNGQITRVVGIAEETTSRKRSEKELRLVQSSLEHASYAIFWFDPEARVVYANEAACRSLGRSHEELRSLGIPDIDPQFTKEVWPAFWEELKTRCSKTFESQHRAKDGRVFPVEVTATYLEFDGQEYGFAFALDITERRKLEGQLRQAQKLEGIGQLAAGIAHEINTPAQFVADNLTFLRDSWNSVHELVDLYRHTIQDNMPGLSPDIAEALKQAERKCDLDFIVTEAPQAIIQSLEGAHRVAEIVRAMKEFSHPDSAEKKATDLNRSIQSTITVARNEWKYVADIAIRFDQTLPPVVCYPGDINQVILNLVVNAAHAVKEKMRDGEKGRITICTRRRDKFAEISVADTGTGIPEAIRSRIFDPFFTTKEVGKGTGQGLSMAHAIIVKKHGGKIWFETEIGTGTTFIIDLPIHPSGPEKEH